MSAHAPAAEPHADAHDAHGDSHGADAHGHAPEAHHALPNSTSRNIESYRFGTMNRVRSMVGDMHTRAREWDLKPIPHGPSKSDLIKTAGLGAAMVAPHLAVAGYAGYKTYQLAAEHTPFKYVDTVIQKGGSMLWNGAKKLTDVVLAPFRGVRDTLKIPATIAMNTVRLGAKAGANVLSFATDIVTDVETAINHQYNLPEGTNWPAQIVIAAKGAAMSVLGLPLYMLKNFPKTTIATGIIGTGLLANAGWDPILASSNFVNGLTETGKWIGGFFPK